MTNFFTLVSAHLRLGQEVAIFIRIKEGKTLEERDVLEHCEEGLARFKHPKYLAFVEKFPTFSTGKIKKVELAKQALQMFPELQDQIH